MQCHIFGVYTGNRLSKQIFYVSGLVDSQNRIWTDRSVAAKTELRLREIKKIATKCVVFKTFWGAQIDQGW